MNYFNYVIVVGLVSFSVAAVCCVALWLAAPMILARALGKERSEAEPDASPAPQAAGGVTLNFSPDQADALAGLLSAEASEDIAIVVSQLPSVTARALLSALSAEVRADVLFSLAQPRSVDMEIVRGIKSELENRLYGSIGGVEAVSILIKALPYSERKSVIENIASRDPVSGSALRGRFIFEGDLAGLGDKDIRALAGAVPPETMAGFLPALQDKLKARLKAEYKGKGVKALEKAAPRKALGRKEKEAALDALTGIVEKLAGKGLMARPRPRIDPAAIAQAAAEPAPEAVALFAEKTVAAPGAAAAPAEKPAPGPAAAPAEKPAPGAAVPPVKTGSADDDDWG